MNTWREQAQAVLAEVYDALPPNATEAQAKAAVSAAYPWGPRQFHPYKIWLSEARRWHDRYFGHTPTKREQDKAALRAEIERRQGQCLIELP